MEPAATPSEEAEERVRCPWCDSDNVERVSEYGPHLMVSQYICLECHNPFEFIRR
jgi:transposase-like protein